MRVIEVAALLAFAGGAVAFGRAIWSRATDPAPAAWEPYHRFDDGRRRVYVRRDDELEPVGEVQAGDPDYDQRFLELMATARERAAVLNSER